MATADDIFTREFRNTLKALGSVSGGRLPIHKLVNPLEGKLDIPEERLFEVRGVESKVFAPLEGQTVSALGKVKPERFIFDRAGKRKVDVHGNEQTETPTTPSGAAWVCTSERVMIPYKYDEEGYNYANAWKNAPGGRHYVYAIPKDYLYPVNLTALAVSVRSMKCFSGYVFKSWHFGNLNLAVIPYRPRAKYTDTIILGTKQSTDYSEEIQEFVNFQIKNGIIPNVPDYTVESGENLVCHDMVPSYSAYEPISERPLSQVNSLSYDDPMFAGSDDEITVE